MALDTTWGGSSSNAYISLTAADSFIQTYVFDATAWTSATTPQREAAIAEATLLIDQFQYIGGRYYSEQKLAFPRRHPNMSSWAEDSEPITESTFQTQMQDAVERACAYQALYTCRLRGDDTHYSNQQRGIQSYTEQVGPVMESATYGGVGSRFVGPAARMQPDAFGLLAPYRTSKKIFRA